MFWKKKELVYNILVPPFEKSVTNMNHKESCDYFEWYISRINERVEYLENYSSITLDYSINSLVDIWDWFLHNAEIEKTPKNSMRKLKKQLKNMPKEIVNEVLYDQEKQFSLQTEYIIRDIAMYFGEVYIKNNPSISWGISRNDDSFINMPVLMGFEDRDFNPPFKAVFEVNFMLRGIACNMFDKDHKKTDLIDLYMTWQRMVFN